MPHSSVTTKTKIAAESVQSKTYWEIPRMLPHTRVDHMCASKVCRSNNQLLWINLVE